MLSIYFFKAMKNHRIQLFSKMPRKFIDRTYYSRTYFTKKFFSKIQKIYTFSLIELQTSNYKIKSTSFFGTHESLQNIIVYICV